MHAAATLFAAPPDLAAAPRATAEDLDAHAANYLRHARRDSAAAKWLHACPPEMRETDFDDARLMPFNLPLRAITGHSHGSKGILASGPTGRGKTRAMWQLMRRLAVDEGRDASYYSAAEWFARLQSWVNYGRDDAQGWVEAVARHDVLFIDDLGQQAVTANKADWAMGWLFHLLDYRLSRGLGLYVTTNLSADQLADHAGGGRYGSQVRADPLIRRLLELCAVVKF